MRSLWLLAFTGVLVGWCPPEGPWAEDAGEPTAPPEEAIVPDAPLLEYRRSGGLAGFDDHLVLSLGGQGVLERRGRPVAEIELDSETLAELAAALSAAQLCMAAPDSVAPPRGADRITYTVVDYTCDVPQEVVVVDGAIPPEMEPLLSSLDGLLTREQ